MSHINKKLWITIFVIISIAIIGSGGALYAQQNSIIHCEACGMTITSDMKAHFHITDNQGDQHYACCQMCMLRLLDPVKGYEQLTINTFCDFYGKEYPITIEAKDYGNSTVVTPSTAVIVFGGKIIQSCANNRIAYNQTAAEALIAQGYTANTMDFQQQAVPEGAPILSISQAAKMMSQKGIAYEPTKASPEVPLLLGVAGFAVIAVSVVAYKKLVASPKN